MRMGRFIVAGVLALGLTSGWGASTAQAQTYIGSYQAWIGPQDLRNSRGVWLDDVAQVLRQDRANFHRFMQADAADTPDPWFHDVGARALLERIARYTRFSRRDIAAIMAGGCLVQVNIYATQNRMSDVSVTVLR